MTQLMITGAAGFIGSELRRQVHSKFQLICIDIKPPKETYPNEHWIQADITNPTEIKKIFQNLEAPTEIAGCIHLAWYYDFSNRSHPFYARFTDSLKYLIQEFSSCVPTDAAFVFASSMAAMKSTRPGQVQNEDWPVWSSWQYPASKVKAGEILRNVSISQPIIELVFAGVYSNDVELVPLFQTIDRIRTGNMQSWFFPGRTDRGLTYVHVEDVARSIQLSVQYRSEVLSRGESVCRLLIGEPTPVSNQLIFDHTCETFKRGKLPKAKIPPFFARLGATWFAFLSKNQFVQPWMIDFAEEHFEFNIQKAAKTIHWIPTRSLKNDLSQVLKRVKENPGPWLEKNKARPWKPWSVGSILPKS